MAHLKRIMYIENKADDTGGGEARIGWVRFSKTNKTLSYQGRTFQRVSGYKYNHVDVETGDAYWISGPKKDGSDRLYGERVPIHIDEDAREVYWTEIRNRPDMRDQARFV